MEALGNGPVDCVAHLNGDFHRREEEISDIHIHGDGLCFAASVLTGFVFSAGTASPAAPIVSTDVVGAFRCTDGDASAALTGFIFGAYAAVPAAPIVSADVVGAFGCAYGCANPVFTDFVFTAGTTVSAAPIISTEFVCTIGDAYLDAGSVLAGFVFAAGSAASTASIVSADLVDAHGIAGEGLAVTSIPFERLAIKCLITNAVGEQ